MLSQMINYAADKLIKAQQSNDVLLKGTIMSITTYSSCAGIGRVEVAKNNCQLTCNLG
jgi:hypothetical protein